jgi:hypothetical protein
MQHLLAHVDSVKRVDGVDDVVGEGAAAACLAMNVALCNPVEFRDAKYSATM